MNSHKTNPSAPNSNSGALPRALAGPVPYFVTLIKKNITLIFYLVLAFCVVSSKNILIYNEELLVVLSSVAFLFFVYHYFGDAISEFLDSRRNAIKYELQKFMDLQQESLKEQISEHKKLFQLHSTLQSFTNFTAQELAAMSKRGKIAVNYTFRSQISQKLNTVSSLLSSNTQTLLQQVLSQNILSPVLINTFFSSAKKKKDTTGPQRRGYYKLTKKLKSVKK